MKKEYQDIINVGGFLADAFRAIIDTVQNLYHKIKEALGILGIEEE